MSFFRLILIITFVFSPAPVFASEILVVEGMKAAPFDNAMLGFKSICRETSRTVVLEEKDNNLLQTVSYENPRLIVAVGARALKEAVKIRNIPILYMMVLNPEEIIGNRPDTGGVSMTVPSEKYLSVIDRLNIQKLKIGIIYDPRHSEALLKRIQHTAMKRGIEVIARQVDKPNDVPVTLDRMKGSFNLLLMLPDRTVITQETVEFMLLESQQTRVPVVTFSEKYVQMGALLSLDIDPFDIGKQTGEMANRVLNGVKIAELPPVNARKVTININHKVANRFGFNPRQVESILNPIPY